MKTRVKTIDVSKKYKVALIFLLDEEVTPQLFAQKVALACGGAALRRGEAIMIEHAKIACVIADEPAGHVSPIAEMLSVSSFGYRWMSTLKRKTAKPTKKRRHA